MNLDFSLHEAQRQILRSNARFKVVAAGRRFGKSYLAAVYLILGVLEEQASHVDSWYVAPTYKLAKDVIWPYLLLLGGPIWKHKIAHEGELQAINGRWVKLRGADRPDLLRGKALGTLVLDEFATMKPDTWEYSLRPTLADVGGHALFIGTPAGRNHFYSLFLQASQSPGMEAWQYPSSANPFLKQEEIDQTKETMSHQAFKREMLASFSEGSGTEFKEEQIILRDEPKDGDVYIAVDPAGYEDAAKLKGSKYARLDETAIAIVKVHREGWHVLDIEVGRWGTRETSIRILQACRRWKPVLVGIEKGALKNAIMPYLSDQMRRLGVYPAIREVTHGNQKKHDRIIWALQGRMEHSRITFSEGGYLKQFTEQLLDFPSALTHDDMLDALAYIDQIAVTHYRDDWQEDTWEPTDWAIGL